MSTNLRMMKSDFSYDLLIIGGGISACVFASKYLQNNISKKIALIEIGRGLGGRSSTRISKRFKGWKLNHGAPNLNICNSNNNLLLKNYINELLENNIQKKELISELKTIDEKKFDFDTRKNLEDEIAETKFLNEKREVQIRIALIQERINSIWKKPSLINKNIQAEFVINLAPSGEILSFDLISSSGDKVFDDSALAALSKIYFITEVIGLERKYFERNFRSFNLVFKSKNQ